MFQTVIFINAFFQKCKIFDNVSFIATFPEINFETFLSLFTLSFTNVEPFNIPYQ